MTRVEKIKKKIWKQLTEGGSGSGNFAHIGVIGQRGGSAPRGGSENPEVAQGRWISKKGGFIGKGAQPGAYHITRALPGSTMTRFLGSDAGVRGKYFASAPTFKVGKQIVKAYLRMKTTPPGTQMKVYSKASENWRKKYGMMNTKFSKKGESNWKKVPDSVIAAREAARQRHFDKLLKAYKETR